MRCGVASNDSRYRRGEKVLDFPTIIVSEEVPKAEKKNEVLN